MFASGVLKNNKYLKALDRTIGGVAYPPKYPMGYNRTKYSRGGRAPTGTSRYAGYRSGRANRVVSRKRRRTRFRRRKLRWGTRVRKQALGLFEGKRHGTTLTNTAVLTNIVKRHGPMTGMITATAPGAASSLGGINTISRATRVGMKIHVRGIKTMLHIVNNSTTDPVDIRIIAGWRRNIADGQARDDEASKNAIFRNKHTQQSSVLLTNTHEGTSMPVTTITAPLTSSKYLYCWKDMVVRLGPKASGDTSEGSGFKLIKLWWELNNKINTIQKDDTVDAANDADLFLDWYPQYWVFGVNPADHNGANANFTLEWHSTVYWKDPIG